MPFKTSSKPQCEIIVQFQKKKNKIKRLENKTKIKRLSEREREGK